ERNQTPKRQAQRGGWHTQPIISRNRMCASLGLGAYCFPLAADHEHQVAFLGGRAAADSA
ncbi:MAG: hypothetical protein DMG19_06225, partial [Acidobacteria bacterium]